MVSSGRLSESFWMNFEKKDLTTAIHMWRLPLCQTLTGKQRWSMVLKGLKGMGQSHTFETASTAKRARNKERNLKKEHNVCLTPAWFGAGPTIQPLMPKLCFSVHSNAFQSGTTLYLSLPQSFDTLIANPALASHQIQTRNYTDMVEYSNSTRKASKCSAVEMLAATCRCSI